MDVPAGTQVKDLLEGRTIIYDDLDGNGLMIGGAASEHLGTEQLSVLLYLVGTGDRKYPSPTWYWYLPAGSEVVGTLGGPISALQAVVRRRMNAKIM